MNDVMIDGVLHTGVPADLKDVVAVYSNQHAFAALTSQGSAAAWGDPRYGGSGVPASLQNVMGIISNSFAFAAVTSQGTVVAWGRELAGGSMTDDPNGDYTGVPQDMGAIKTIFGETRYFADSSAPHLYPCPHNTYGPGFLNCTACPQGSEQPLGRPGIRSEIWSCKDCTQSPDKYSTDGTTCGSACPASYHVAPYNWYGNTGDEERCFTCLPGTYFSDNDCKLCTLGRYQSDKGQGSCNDCAAGRYTRDGMGSTECSPCVEGKTVLPGRGYAVSDCFKVCLEGEYGSTEDDKCRPCDPGSYNGATTGVDKCTLCETGKSQPLTMQSTCSACAKGKWASTRGAMSCTSCPPGSYCPSEAMSRPEPCPVGNYTDTDSRESCKACPPGQFQNSTGSAKCFSCPLGTFLDGEGANSSSQCLPCSPGSYGDKEGLPQCTRCPTGQVQPSQ